MIWMLTTGDALTLPSTICTPRNPKRARASMLSRAPGESAAARQPSSGFVGGGGLILLGIAGRFGW